MNRRLKVAIDHGTTNSAIAVMEAMGPRTLKPNARDPFMPSVVYMNNQGRVFIGHDARRATLENHSSEGIAHGTYKPTLGKQDSRYAFPKGEPKTGVDLAAMVMTELIKAYHEETGETPQAAVITVPAKFEAAQRMATAEAAAKAGLKHAPLLQEPIAAALAYGFQKSTTGRWMVFDLGGGTLDVSLVFAKDRDLRVPEEGHEGDNMLGGVYFDRELMDVVVKKLKEKYSLDGFGGKSTKYGRAWQKLLFAVEEAKIRLSTRESAAIEIDGLCDDTSGKAVDVKVEVTRAEYEKLIAPHVRRAVAVCRKLLANNRLTAKDIDSIILVGGPSKTPYIQKELRRELGIPLSADVDPMTAVADGAAIYAATQDLPETLWDQPAETSSGAYLHVEYEPESKVDSPLVTFQLDGMDTSTGDIRCEIERRDKAWKTSFVLDETGFAEGEVELLKDPDGKPRLSEFVTTARDSVGRVLARVEEPKIWHRLPGADIRLPNTLRVALVENNTAVLVPRGTALPAKGAAPPLVTVRSLEKGSSEDVLRIPVVEGDDEAADCCVHVASLNIAGTDEGISADLPAGSAVEVTVELDSSSHIALTAYVPLLDAEFEAEFGRETHGVSAKDVAERFTRVKKRLEGIQRVQKRQPDAAVQAALAEAETDENCTVIEKEIERAEQGEEQSLARAHQRSLELDGKLRSIQELQLGASLMQRIEDIRGLAQGEELERLGQIEDEVKTARRNKDNEQLRRLEDRLEVLEISLRDGPISLLVDDWAAFPQTFRGTRAQLDAFREAQALLLEIIDANKAGNPITPEQMRRVTGSHRKLMDLWPELPGWKREVQEGRRSGRGGLSDVTLARS